MRTDSPEIEAMDKRPVEAVLSVDDVLLSRVVCSRIEPLVSVRPTDPEERSSSVDEGGMLPVEDAAPAIELCGQGKRKHTAGAPSSL